MSLGHYDVLADPSKQFERYDQNLISDPLPWYRNASPWGEPVGAPCTLVEFLWGSAMRGLDHWSRNPPVSLAPWKLFTSMDRF